MYIIIIFHVARQPPLRPDSVPPLFTGHGVSDYLSKPIPESRHSSSKRRKIMMERQVAKQE